MLIKNITGGHKWSNSTKQLLYDEKDKLVWKSRKVS